MMTKRDIVDDFQRRSMQLERELNELADDMTAYTAKCHKVRIMLKRYNRIVKAQTETFGCINAAISEMNQWADCMEGVPRA